MQLKIHVINFLLFLTTLLLVILVLYNFFMYEESVSFLEKYLSSDNHIEQPLGALLFFPAFLLYFIGILFFIKRYLLGLKDIVPAKMEPLQYIHYGVVILLIVLFFMFGINQTYMNDTIFKEDGFFENFTVVLALLSSLIFFYLGIYYKAMDKKIFLFLFAVLLFFYSMEEISWGQRIFDWETPKALSEVNYQNEINVHNIYINPSIGIIYYIFFLFVSSLFLFRDKYIDLFSKNKVTKVIAEMYPSNQYFYAGFIYMFIAFATLKIDNELSEEVLTITIFIYAMDLLYKKFSSTKLKTSIGEERMEK